MASSASAFRHLRCQRQLANAGWHQIAQRRCSPLGHLRRLTTQSFLEPAESSTEKTEHEKGPNEEIMQLPFQGVRYARAVPTTPSYYSRQPRFNDLYVGITKLLAEYRHLPIVSAGDAPPKPWIRLPEMRTHMGEQIKASHYARVMRVARRLNLIEPSLVPQKVRVALAAFARAIDPSSNKPNPTIIDGYGRAIATGKRKESTARAFVVEGTGQVLINGKTLSEAFGRVHDRESAVWALLATKRLDKYNVWALVEGGGTTGQAEALTMAVAKALLAHEPALKPALRKAGCITRDIRTVERKKHGHVKARKMPAWVKR